MPNLKQVYELKEKSRVIQGAKEARWNNKYMKVIEKIYKFLILIKIIPIFLPIAFSWNLSLFILNKNH